jgi:hypothetical protein
MTEKRVSFNQIVKSQLPAYVREEFPLVAEFLSQYYISQEYQGAPTDLIQNIDRYIKLNETTGLVESVTLNSNISFDDTTITISSSATTDGFPDSYGLLKINDEIITYTSKNRFSFNGCIRGFSGVSSYQNNTNPENLVFESTEAQEHFSGDTIENLSISFLNEFLKKTKKLFLPGFDNRDFAIKSIERFPGDPNPDQSELNQNIFIKQSKDFYSTKGTDQSFKILFKALYGSDVEIIKPRDFLFRPSDAGFRITNDLVVESVSGNPFDLENLTLFQDQYGDIDKAYAPVTKVEKVNAGISSISYYRVSLDSGYDRDIIVDGAVYGTFSIHSKTKIIGNVSIGQTYIDVDSTLGFPNSGELSVTYPNEQSGVISYTSKTLTQFIGCSGVSFTIPDNTSIDVNTFAYAYVGVNTSNQVRVKIRSVLNSLNVEDESAYHLPGEKLKIKTLGIEMNDKKSNNWYFNTSSTQEIENIERRLPKNYRVTLFDPHLVRIGDKIIISGSDGSIFDNFKITNILNEKVFDCEGDIISNLNANFTFKRKRLKASSSLYNISTIDANVQNVYNLKEKTLVSSSSIPVYSDSSQNSKSINTRILSYNLNGIFPEGDTIRITSTTDHGFYTGDEVYYTPQQLDADTVIGSLFDEGIYYVFRVDSNNIKLSRSRSNIFNGIFVELSSDKEVFDNKIELLRFKDKTLANQKILREISPPVNDGKIYPTLFGQTGILINGVEILNYKSKDFIYYGNIENIDVIAGGEDYDIVNAPRLVIRDSVGTGATGYVSIKGNLKEIKIIDSGFDYVDTPVVRISGGNGSGATAEVVLTDTIHEVSFNSEERSALVDITNNTIGFTTYHKFRNNEQVIYKTSSERAISGLSTDANYYVSVQNTSTIKLHKTYSNSVLGINTISLLDYGTGNHTFESIDKKKVVSSIVIRNSGEGYENKLRTCPSAGINTALNLIEIDDHGYKSGEIITYNVDGTAASGISTSSQYYVTSIDENSFHISNVGLATSDPEFFYRTKQYVNITSSGIGTHLFNYPEISVQVIGNIGIASVSDDDFKCKVQPIFKGEITSVHLLNNGNGYGSSIINYKKEPLVEIDSGFGASFTPIIVNGRISEVLIDNGGYSYTSPPELVVTGDGDGAELTSVLTNGRVTSVKIANPGAGYDQYSTKISAISSGSGSKFITNIKSWNINLFQRYLNILSDDDGVIVDGINDNYGLEYCHMYVPRGLRRTSYSIDSLGNSLYQEPDLKVDSAGNEIVSEYHSPIIGWAYDGNPIYGPYGYSSKTGGFITRMKSSYILSPDSGRPPEFPDGFFVEDYVYIPSDDDAFLDENNGRFCKTPDFPNGTYAYFATFNDEIESDGIFVQRRSPIFPYLIGKNYQSKPNSFNFNPGSNQDQFNLNDGEWIRNTYPYNFTKKNSYYDYVLFPNKLKEHLSKVVTTQIGTIDSIGIETGGTNYKVNDSINLDLKNSKGKGFFGEVSKISGKSISSVSVSSTSIVDVEFYPLGKSKTFIGFSSIPHSLNNFDTIEISGLSTSFSSLKGFYQVGINSNRLSIAGFGTTSFGISSTGITGIVTYIPVTGSLDFLDIRENDILNIESEKVKVLNVDEKSSRIRVLREYDGTIGSAHTANTPIFEDPRKFSIISNYDKNFSVSLNKEIYFNPSESLGLGSSFGVGIGSTLTFSNPGAGVTQITIPTKSIYIPDHELKTGDSIVYNSNGGDSIVVSSDGITTSSLPNNSIVYIYAIDDDLIGISTVKVGLGSTGTIVGVSSTTSDQSTLYFSGFGTGVYHSFKTNYSEILSSRIDKNLVTVSTAETHGLTSFDLVDIEVNPSIAKTFSIKYNDYNRRLIIGEKEFTSSNVDVESNEIYIFQHGLKSGQSVIYTASSPSGGLENNKIYYVYVVDRDRIKLTNTLYDSLSSNPSIIDITSSFDGKLSLINPPIDVYKNSTIIFDLTDSSLSHVSLGSSVPSFDFNIFVDENFTNKYNSIENNSLIVKKTGTIGVTTDAKLEIILNNNSPELLHYKLSPVNISSIPDERKEIVNDENVYKNNTIFIKKSIYSGKFSILTSSDTTFTYNLEKYPERDGYTPETASLYYSTTSLDAKGPIKEVDVLNGGYEFDIIPGVSSIRTLEGSGAILNLESSSIGSIKKTKIENIGFDYPTDFTLRPSVKIAEVLDLQPLSSFESIGVTSTGIGYVVAPELVVIDGKTEEQITDVDLRYNIGDDTVDILKNTKGLFELEPTIIPVKNCNGVGISSIFYNSANKDVTVRLSVGFTTVGGFPFAVNDKILIENISISETDSEYRGYNSENYNYELFTLTGISPDYGGLTATITYNLSESLLEGESPGTFNPLESSGRVIPEKYFPTFKSTLRKNIFYEGEPVETLDGISSGKLFKFDPITEKSIVETVDDFEVGKILLGKSSDSQAIIIKSSPFNINKLTYKLDSFSRVIGGWAYDAGVLNDNKQRVQDSFYYQNFSYSLKSNVDFDSWNDIVSNLNHTAGFKKFSDFQLESEASDPTSMVVGISTDLTDLDLKIDFIGVIDLNCVYNFDLVSENALNINSNLVSDKIIFNSAILSDYFESFGNRVLLFDDISDQFNSNPRTTRYSVVHRSPSSSIRTQKYIIFTRDSLFTDERQLTIASFLIDNDNNTYLNQYGIYSQDDLGDYDVFFDGTDILLLFYPNKFEINNYDVTSISYSLKDTLTSVGSSHFGPVSIASSSILVSTGTTTTLVGIASTYISSKILVEMGTPDGRFQYDEISLIHDNANVSLLEFSSLDNSSGSYVGLGLGTYNAYISGSNINLDFSPNPGIAATVNLINVSIADTSSTGIGTYQMKNVRIEGSSTSIASSTSPIEHNIATFDESYDAAYFIVQVSDITNNRHQVSEVLVLENDAESLTYQTEFGNLETNSGLGTIGSYHTHPIDTNLTFTPLPNIDVEVKVYMNAFQYDDENINGQIDLNNAIIETDFSEYLGTKVDIKREFDLTYQNYPVFVRNFLGNDPNFVNINKNEITIANHYFVTGEELSYTHNQNGSSAIGIATTTIPGIGTTDKLPSTVYAVKIDDKTLKFSSSAENALKIIPEVLDITHVGIGASHTLTAKNQNNKVLIAIDNNIQSPIVSTSQTTSLAKEAKSFEDILFFTGITSFFGGDLVKIGDEIVRIDGVGIGSTNAIRVTRSWMGTANAGYSTGSLVTKISGNYNIVGNTLNFASAPYGNIPLSTTSNPPDSRDWVGISTGSKFHGRMFMRSGDINGINDPYYKNYIFDDISDSFTGISSIFTLTSSGSDITGITTGSIILINEIFQSSGRGFSGELGESYNLRESGGKTNIEFVGTARTLGSDVGISSFPRGGMIVSVGSSAGFGYQPLISAGGTSIVSIAGTIQSISIGNSGSGYRQVQTVNVGIFTSTTGIPNIEFIGTAIVSNGNIVSVAITNPGFGYTTSNPPYVIFDDPLSYSNIPLIYSNNSPQGIGTSASINVIVGQGSSIIDFEIISTGYAYGQGEVLTLPVGGAIVIPTTSDYIPFELSIEKTISDKFSGWTIGDLQVLDNFDSIFNGERRSFSLKLFEENISILASPGSNIDVEQTLLIFINDILQVPGESYRFRGGNLITFTEAPKEGDTSKVIFYRGSGNIDVIEREVLSSIEKGDTLIINYSPILGQKKTLQEETRLVTSIDDVNVVSTNPYYGPGNVNNPDLLRPVTWCRQTEDIIIDTKIVGKSRELYEANINPSSYLIKSIGIGDTEIFVDNVRPFFNPINETNEEVTPVKLDPFIFQKDIVIISQDTKISAAATAVVSVAGTISSIVLENGGVGYTTTPTISIAGIGVGATITAQATANISNGSVISIAIDNPGLGYTSSNLPKVLFESPLVNKEQNRITSYEGDFGIITGITTTSIGIASTALVFDLTIPKESFLRDSSVTGVTTISGIQTSYYFVVYESNVGNGVTSLESDNSILGIGTAFLDNVYKVSSVSIAQTDVIGMGVTYVARVVVSISDYNSLTGVGSSNFYGRYSWGRLLLAPRLEDDSIKTYNAYLSNGVTGIKTGSLVTRLNPLRYQDYIL